MLRDSAIASCIVAVTASLNIAAETSVCLSRVLEKIARRVAVIRLASFLASTERFSALPVRALIARVPPGGVCAHR